MFGLSDCELLFYGGITVMAVSAVLGVFCIIFFILSGRKLKEKLEEKYGKLR